MLRMNTNLSLPSSRSIITSVRSQSHFIVVVHRTPMSAYIVHQCQRQSLDRHRRPMCVIINRLFCSFSIQTVHELQFRHSRMNVRSVISPKLRRSSSQGRCRNEASPDHMTCILADVVPDGRETDLHVDVNSDTEEFWERHCEFLVKLLGTTKRQRCKLVSRAVVVHFQRISVARADLLAALVCRIVSVCRKTLSNTRTGEKLAPATLRVFHCLAEIGAHVGRSPSVELRPLVAHGSDASDFSVAS